MSSKNIINFIVLFQAHYGIRNGEKDFKVQIKWTNGKINNYKIPKIGKTYIFQESKISVNSNASLTIR